MQLQALSPRTGTKNHPPLDAEATALVRVVRFPLSEEHLRGMYSNGGGTMARCGRRMSGMLGAVDGLSQSWHTTRPSGACLLGY